MAKSKQSFLPGVLALSDGTLFKGVAFGAIEKTESNQSKATVAEVVFNTSMYGYQEILTDPSYAGQMICFTYPHIGNVGCNSDDYESPTMHASAVIIRELSKLVSNFRSEESLESFLQRESKIGLAKIDTRSLVKHLRDKGAQMGAIGYGTKIDTDSLVDQAKAQGSMLGKDYVQYVTRKDALSWNHLNWNLDFYNKSDSKIKTGYKELSDGELWSRPHVVALDCGMKDNISRLLLESGFRVTLLPAFSSVEQIISHKPDALFISNGPGDPATLLPIVSTVKELLGRLPIFGICLGHQILGQALGGKTYKLKFGHRGGNHPVKDLKTGKVEITVQNHGFAVDSDSLPADVEVTHINLNDQTVEGLASKKYKAFSVQYHPEASSGPHDSRYLFRRFFESVVSV